MIEKIAAKVSVLYYQENRNALISYADSLIKITTDRSISDTTLSDIYYYAGMCLLSAGKNLMAVDLLKKSISIKKQLGIKDKILSNALFNISIIYTELKDYENSIKNAKEYIELVGIDSAASVEAYSILIGQSFDKKDFEAFTRYCSKALDIISKFPGSIDDKNKRILLSNIGAGYVQMGDYVKAKIYLTEAEDIFLKSKESERENYINVINSLAITYWNLKQEAKENEYFQKGIELALADKSEDAFNFVNSYALSLGKKGEINRGKLLLEKLLDRIEKLKGSDSFTYTEVLSDYAGYLSYYGKDSLSAYRTYLRCIDFLEKNNNRTYLRNHVLPDYAVVLFKLGKTEEAMKVIQDLLLSSASKGDPYLNPPADSIKANTISLDILRLKHKILFHIYKESKDERALEAAASTSDLMISVLDRIRTNISEEQSRLILGNRFRGTYLDAIDEYSLAYKNTGNERFLNRAFEFAEKSKVAGLLEATKEMNAIQFNIPQELADFEKSLQYKIGYLNSAINEENLKDIPDINRTSELNRDLIKYLKARDSLLLAFEKNYHGYYSLKYRLTVPSIDEIPAITGRNNNYLNYVVSDSVVYIFLVNRKTRLMESFRIDSALTGRLKKFRSLLSDRGASDDARIKFGEYQRIGYELYRMLIEPVRGSFVSDNLIISPDNMLSYIPFETLITRIDSSDTLMNYRDLSYLMNDFNISYTYSATFMKELNKQAKKPKYDLVAFAPVYEAPINTDSLFVGRQSGSGILYNLPEAIHEADYIARISGGKVYLYQHAKESVFKKEAGNYRIIHLAMHTYLSDKDPMQSAMIFNLSKDTPEDGLLHTWEVYGLPLRASMVVLSSCNSGNGVLSSGEGILSLARGFIYSGCQSVVMSMWEVDDKSGTEVMKMFYDNLLKGKSKSMALRDARREYLKKARQLWSHPYFWSSLIVYGENEPVYSGKKPLKIASGILILAAVLAGVYLLKRRYS